VTTRDTCDTIVDFVDLFRGARFDLTLTGGLALLRSSLDVRLPVGLDHVYNRAG